jgi:Ca-activated chloride channel homolog
MELAWPSLLPSMLTGGAVAVLVIVVTIRLVHSHRHGIPVAHTDILRREPRFRRALRAYRALLVLASITALVALGASAVAASRIVHSSSTTPEVKNRDIVLCLDVSSSMTSADTSILTTFERLARNFSGERIGLVLFNGSPLQVFPLTTDYEFVRSQLKAVEHGLSNKLDGYAYRDGTSVGDGSSKIGDGVAGCLIQFDQIDEKRSRTLVLATDYLSVGASIVSPEAATALATTRRVAIYGLNPAHHDGRPPSARFQRDAEATGGAYFSVRHETDALAAVQNIVQRVTSDPATATKQSPVKTITDTPEGVIWILTGAIGVLFALAWRLKL